MIGAWRADDVYEPSVIETVLPTRPELLNGAGRAIGCVPEEIDAGGLYCALAKYEHYLRHECRPFDGDALGPDFNWGIELRRQGYKNYVDYSVAVEHCKPDGTSIHPRSTNPVQMRFVQEGSSWSGKVLRDSKKYKESRSVKNIEIFQSNGGQWYFHVKGDNGEILAQSEGYTRKSDALQGLKAMERIIAKGNMEQPADELETD